MRPQRTSIDQHRPAKVHVANYLPQIHLAVSSPCYLAICHSSNLTAVFELLQIICCHSRKKLICQAPITKAPLDLYALALHRDTPTHSSINGRRHHSIRAASSPSHRSRERVTLSLGKFSPIIQQPPSSVCGIAHPLPLAFKDQRQPISESSLRSHASRALALLAECHVDYRLGMQQERLQDGEISAPL